MMETPGASASAYEQFIQEEEEIAVLEAGESGTERVRWSDEQTKLLLVLYGDSVKEVGPTKRFKKKEMMYPFIRDEMSRKGHIFTIKQIKNKWTLLERQYKKVIDNNRKTGRSKQTCSFQRELDELLGAKSSINPSFVLETSTDSSCREKDFPYSATGVGSAACNYSDNIQTQVSDDLSQNLGTASVSASNQESDQGPVSTRITVADLKDRNTRKRTNKKTVVMEELKRMREVKEKYYEEKAEALKKKQELAELALQKKTDLMEKLQMKVFQTLLKPEL